MVKNNGKIIQEVKLQRNVNLKFTRLHMQICMHQLFALVKLHQVVKRKIEKAMGGGMMTAQPRAMYGRGGGVCTNKRNEKLDVHGKR